MTRIMTIRANHDECGEILLKSDTVTVIIINDTYGKYSFTCPECEQHIIKEASEKIVGLLINTGVNVIKTTGHPEYPDATKPPLTRMDLMNFMKKVRAL